MAKSWPWRWIWVSAIRKCYLESGREGSIHWMSRRDKLLYELFIAKGEFSHCNQQVDARFCRVCAEFRDNG